MKDFFRECLEQLEDKTGIRQLFFLKTQCESQTDFDKRKNILLDSMVIVSKRFDFIPEEYQQKYILRMITEDQQYDSLNSRTIWRWLDLHKDKHMTTSRISEEELTPCPPEKVDLYANQILENMAKIGNTGKAAGDPIIAELKDKFKSGMTPREKFIIEGIEIQAVSKEEAQKAYNATFN